MRFRILGPLAVLDADRSVRVPPGHQRSLLALLLTRARRTVTTDHIIDALWHDGELPTDPANAVQGIVSRLRKITTNGSVVLQKQGAGYVLDVSAEAIDAQRFEQLADEGRQALANHDPESAMAAFTEGLELWRGPALEDAREAPWAVPEIQRLEEQRLAVAEDRANADLTLGRHVTLLPDLEDLVARHPLRERLRGQLMLALYRSGRQADALAVYRDAHQLLRDELGIEPEARLRQLQQQILEQSADLDWRPLGPPGPARPAPAPPPAAVRSDETTVVGRATQLAALSDAWRQAERGRGSVALITGEPGVGKSHLVTAFADAVQATGGEVAWAGCVEHEGSPPFWPWVQLLRAMAEDLGDEALAQALASGADDIAHMVPEIADRVVRRTSSAATAGDPVQARFRLYDAVCRFIGRAAVDGPRVVVIEDIHWADTPSLELLGVLASNVRTMPLLLVVTYRDGDVGRDATLNTTLTRLAREPVVHRHLLQGLSAAEVSEVVTARLGATPSQELVEVVHHRTGGNPFFVTELLRLLVDRSQQTGHLPPDLAMAAVPAGIREVIDRRLSTLPTATRTALDAAAVTGREFRVTTVAAGAAMTVEEVLTALHPAVTAGLVAAHGSSSTYRFSHVLVRDTIYAALSGAVRVRMHAGIAESLDAVGDDRSLAQVAHHYEQAAPLGLGQRAIDAAMRAAEHAERSLAFEQAAHHLRRALRLVETTGAPPARELEVRSRLVRLLLETGGYASPEVYEVAAPVRTLAADIGTAPQVVGLTWALWVHSCVRANFPHALDIADDLLHDGTRWSDAATIAAGHQARGTTLWHLGRIDEAAAELESGVEGFATIGVDELRRRGLQHAAVLGRCHTVHPFWLLGTDGQAEQHLLDATALARELNDPYEAVFCRLFRAWLATLRGDADAAWHLAHRAETESDANGFSLLGALASCLAGWAQAVRGDHTAGVDRIEEAIRAADATGAHMLRHFHLGLLADAHHRCGTPAAAAVALQQAIEASDRTGEAFHLPALHALRTQLS